MASTLETAGHEAPSLEPSMSAASSDHEDETFHDIETASRVEDDSDELKAPMHAQISLGNSPRSSNASESSASAETGLTAPDLHAGGKRTSGISDGSTVDSVPLDEVSLDAPEEESGDLVSPLPNSQSFRSPKLGTPTPDGPIASGSRSPSLTSGQFEGRRPSWRHSTPLSPVALSTSSVLEDGEGSVDGTAGTSRKAKRRTMASVNSATSDNANFDFLLQRLAVQNALLSDDPKARRRSVQATDSLRKSFERLHHELAAEEGLIDWDFWGAVMNDYEKVAREQPRELARAIQRGIPSALRGMMWQLMCSSRDPDLETAYQHLIKTPSSHEKAIMRDLARTFPSHEYFKDNEGVGQGNLFNVVKAYSLYDAEVGYCQGLQFIVGPMLLNMPDEEAFCVLVRLMKSYDLRSHFMPEMPGLQLRLFQFDRLLEEHLPALFLHLLRQGVKSSMYASQWFLTMLSYRYPLELVYSVLDLVFAEGVEAILRFSLALMKRNETVMLGLEFEHLLEYLKNSLYEVYKIENPVEDGPQYAAADFVKDALKIHLSPSHLDQLAHEWTSMCSQRDAQSMELERMRTANTQLSAQVRKLEASLSQLNEEHCDLVRQLVHARLEREEVEEELVKWKVAVASAGVELTIN